MPRLQIKDEYEIVGEIGAGGMATVYKAVQKSLGRPVAIKELKRVYHADAQIVKRFERESRVAASLQHENIVHIYDYWNKPTCPPNRSSASSSMSGRTSFPSAWSCTRCLPASSHLARTMPVRSPPRS